MDKQKQQHVSETQRDGRALRVHIEPGTYVLATTYRDGYSTDPWAVGYFHKKVEGALPRAFQLVDSVGNPFPRRFSKIMPITGAMGDYLLTHRTELEQANCCLFDVVRGLPDTNKLVNVAVAVREFSSKWAGFDLQYREHGWYAPEVSTTENMPWRVRIHVNKNSVGYFRTVTHGKTPEEAIERAEIIMWRKGEEFTKALNEQGEEEAE